MTNFGSICYALGIVIAVVIGSTGTMQESTGIYGASELPDCASTVSQPITCSGANVACTQHAYMTAANGGTSPNAIDVTYLGATVTPWQCSQKTGCSLHEPFTYKTECKK
ncbi:MAG: hypothetical protein LBG58_00975 [Planctomycetaceae bacterium]|jgi:hypothetical protein|nr:hypothetical protein [Planctomycetaceae bacterium]